MKLHLPKGLFVAVVAAMAAMMPASYAASTEVWVNFGGTNYGVTEDGKTWNNILGDNAAALRGTYTLLDKNGAAAGTLTLKANHNPYDSKGAASLDILKGYLDYNAANSATYWTVNLSLDDIAATGITVNAYNSGDGNNPIAPLTVNGKNYVGDASEAATNYINHESSISWGDSKAGAQETELNGKNTVTVTNLSGIVTMTPMTTTSNDQGRFTLAGLSIEWDGSTSATGVELDTGVNNADSYLQGVETANRIYSLSGNADNTSTFHIAAGETVQGLQSAANTVTITSNGAIGVNQLWAKAGTTLNLGATLTSGSDLSIGGLGTINFAANQTIGKLTSTAATVSVAEGAQLTIGSMESATEAGEFITNVTGKGSIEFKSDVYIVGGQSLNASWQPKSDATCTTVQFAGDLKISNKATLTVGNSSGGHHYGYWTDLSNLKSVQLTDATIYFHSRADKLKSLIVNAGSDESDYTSTLKLFQVTGVEQTPEAITIQSLTLNDDLLVKSTYTSQVVVESMTGAGNLNIYGTESGGTLEVSLTTGADYSGIISVGNSRSDSTTVTVNIADGTTLNDTQLVKTGTDNKASISLKGAGNYNITSPTSAITNGLTNDKSWTGTVKMSGATLGNANNKATLSDYGNAKSTIRFDDVSQSTGYFATESVNPNIELYGNNTACLDLASGQLTFTGKVSGGGNMGTSAGAASEVAVTFTGDVSEWTGVYWAAKATDITYSGNAKSIKNTLTAGEGAESTVTFVNTSGMTVDGGINNQKWSNGTLNLKVQNGENAAGTVVFNGEVFAGKTGQNKTVSTNLTVDEGASAKFTNANVKLTNVTMEKGASLAITAAKTLTFQNLTLADGTTINPRAAATLVDAAEATTNVSITVSKKASFGEGATINADLTLASGATVEMADALTLGGTLTLNTGLTLGGELLTTIVGFAGQTDTQKQILFTVAGLNLVGADALTTAAEVGISETKVAFSDYFTNEVTTETGNYYLGYDGSNVYVEFVAKADEPEEDPSTPEGGGNVPEPTTGALSLIGLAALAMRRRRK